VDNTVSFSRNRVDYVLGFGDEDGNYWIRLQKLYIITEETQFHRLRIEYESFTGQTEWAEYEYMYVKGDSADYELKLGKYDSTASTAPNKMHYNSGWPFTTKDKDNDEKSDAPNCALFWSAGGGFWHRYCTDVNPTAEIGYLNGPNQRGYVSYVGAFDNAGLEHLKTIKMMLKER